MFSLFRLRVSVFTRNALSYCALPTDTPAAGVSVMECRAPPTPRIGGVGRQDSRIQ